MTKKQAETFIYKIGKKYAHLTIAPYFCLLLVSLAIFGAALGFCRNLDFIITVSCFALFGLVFTAVAVKKYMSLKRASVIMFVLWALPAVSIGCFYYAVRLFNQTFVAWECGVYSAVAAFTFAIGCAVKYIFANHAMLKKIIVIAMGGTLSVAVSITGVVLSVLKFADVSLSMGAITFNAIVCLILLFASKFAVRVFVMLRFKVTYKPEALSVGATRKEIESKKKMLFTTLHGFVCGEYTFYIYAKKDCYRIDMYSGKTRISRNTYETVKSLFDAEKIDDKKLSKLWDTVERI